jgi:hypothetical protein
MFEMDPSIVPPSNEVGLLDGTKDVANKVLGISEKLPIQTKRESTILPNNLPKRVTRTRCPLEDVTQIGAVHGGPKGSNKSMEVMRLFFESPSKIGGNSTPQGMGKQIPNKSNSLSYVHSYFPFQVHFIFP